MDLNYAINNTSNIFEPPIHEKEINEKDGDNYYFESADISESWLYSLLCRIHIRPNGSYIIKIGNKYTIKYKNEDFIYTIAELPYLSHPLELFAGPYSDKYRLASYNYLSILEDNKYKNTYNVGTHGGYFLCCWNLKSNNYSIKFIEASIAPKNVSGPRQILSNKLIDFFNTELYEGFIIPVSTLTLTQYRKNPSKYTRPDQTPSQKGIKFYSEVFLTLETSLKLAELRRHLVSIYTT